MEHLYPPLRTQIEEAANTAQTKDSSSSHANLGGSWTDVLSFLKLWNQVDKLSSNETRKAKHKSYVSPSVL